MGDADDIQQVPFTDNAPDPVPSTDPAGATESSQEPGNTREENRAARGAERERERKEMERKLRELEERDRERAIELSRLKGQLEARQPTATGADPYEARLNEIYERQSEAYQAAQAEIAAKTYTPERAKHYETLARKFESEKMRVHSEAAVAATAPQLRHETAREGWRQKYPDVYNNAQAYQYAEATFRRKQALLRPGEQPTAKMVDEAMEETRAALRLGGRSAPSRAERDRFSGIPSSGSGGGDGLPSGIVMTPDLRKMATALHPNLPEKEAVEKWVNSAGKELRKQKVL